MATNHRLFVDQPLSFQAGEPASIILSSDSSHYLARVLRLQNGAEITLFNGDGNNYGARLTNADKRAAELQIVSQQTEAREAPNLYLAIALLKGDKLDYALQKATELDVNGVWLLQTQRSELRLNSKRLANRMQHWRRIMLSACEQSGRTWVPELAEPLPLANVLTQTATMQRYCLDPAASPGELATTSRDLCLFTGPEGGFDDAERALLTEHCQSIQLGRLVLRAETAPLVGLALAGAARRKS